MNDEKYLYLQDIADKKRTGRSAFNRKPHGKSGCRFPSDYLSKKELEKMNGEVQAYRLNEPLKWSEFKQMPEDIRKIYIMQLRNKFNILDRHLMEVFGCSHFTVEAEIKRLNLGKGRKNKTYIKDFREDEFYRWLHGVQIAKKVDRPLEQKTEMQGRCDIPAEEEREMPETPKTYTTSNVAAQATNAVSAQRLTPSYGMVTFKGAANDVLRVVAEMLQDAELEITVTWKRVEQNE